MKNGLVAERQQEGSLSYLLLQPGLLSATAYKVLQSQEKNGFVRCVRVLENGRDKLVYDTENLRSLAELLPGLAAPEFARLAAEALDALLRLREIGFLQLANTETGLDRLFVEPESGKICLVYLPVTEAVTAELGNDALGILKYQMDWALKQYPSLGAETLAAFCAQLHSPGSGLVQLREALGALVPVAQRPAEPTGNIGTGTISLSGEVGHASSEVSMEAQAQTEIPAESKKKKSGLFAKEKKRPAQNAYPEYEGGGTEVLDEVFSPLIVLEGVQTAKKLEFVIDRRQFVIGKSAEAVDGLIDFSTAVSRRHCQITSNEGKNYLTDLASANGTFLNGRKLEADKPALIHEGDKIKLANISFVVKDI